MTYELALSILFHVLIEEREKLVLDQELVLYTFQNHMRLSCGLIIFNIIREIREVQHIYMTKLKFIDPFEME